ncbi:S9 family peptidase [bacterium]|nr:S9 family peptidase [bacterium]
MKLLQFFIVVFSLFATLFANGQTDQAGNYENRNVQNVSNRSRNFCTHIRQRTLEAGFTSASSDTISEAKRSVTPEDLVAIREVSDAQVSPDGLRIAFVVREAVDSARPDPLPKADIWIVPTDGNAPARRLTSHLANDTTPRWSPEGRRLAFLSDRPCPQGALSGAGAQLWLLRLDGGEAEPVTALRGEVLRFRWSPDGSMIAFTLREAPSEEEVKKSKDGDDARYADHNYRYSRLYVVRLVDGHAEPVSPQRLEISDFDWSPGGEEIAIVTAKTPRMEDVHYQPSRLVVIRRQGGQVARTLSEAIAYSEQIVRWSPDGHTIAFSTPSPANISIRVALVPAAGGRPRYLLDDYPGSLWTGDWGAEWDSDSEHLLFQSFEAARTRLLRVKVSTEAVQVLGEAQTFLWPGRRFSASADSRVLAYVSGTGQSPDDVWVLRIGEPGRRLTSLHPQAASWRLGESEEISWKSSQDGRIIHGVLITPPGFRKGNPQPTVVQVHGGPEWAWWAGWHGSAWEWGQLLASHGFVVLLPNPRGSSGQGWRFAEANRDDWGGGDFTDIMDGLDHLIDQKIADPHRLGIGGGSYGGYMTAWAVTQTNRFKAAVMSAGLSNLASSNGSGTFTPSFFSPYFLGTHIDRPDAYWNRSPLAHVKNCRTPTLVLHGEADDLAPVGQGWEFYHALRLVGTETEMVVYPREPHGISERAHQVDVLQRVLDWFERHLGPGPEPALNVSPLGFGPG